MTGEEEKQDLRTVEQIIDDMNLFDDINIILIRTILIDRHFRETDSFFDDGSHIIYVNAKYRGNV